MSLRPAAVFLKAEVKDVLGQTTPGQENEEFVVARFRFDNDSHPTESPIKDIVMSSPARATAEDAINVMMEVLQTNRNCLRLNFFLDKKLSKTLHLNAVMRDMAEEFKNSKEILMFVKTTSSDDAKVEEFQHAVDDMDYGNIQEDEHEDEVGGVHNQDGNENNDTENEVSKDDVDQNGRNMRKRIRRVTIEKEEKKVSGPPSKTIKCLHQNCLKNWMHKPKTSREIYFEHVLTKHPVPVRDVFDCTMCDAKYLSLFPKKIHCNKKTIGRTGIALLVTLRLSRGFLDLLNVSRSALEIKSNYSHF